MGHCVERWCHFNLFDVASTFWSFENGPHTTWLFTLQQFAVSKQIFHVRCEYNILSTFKWTFWLRCQLKTCSNKLLRQTWNIFRKWTVCNWTATDGSIFALMSVGWNESGVLKPSFSNKQQNRSRITADFRVGLEEYLMRDSKDTKRSLDGKKFNWWTINEDRDNSTRLLCSELWFFGHSNLDCNLKHPIRELSKPLQLYQWILYVNAVENPNEIA